MRGGVCRRAMAVSQEQEMIAGIEESLTKEKALSAETEKQLRAAIEEFKKSSPLVQQKEKKPAATAEAPAEKGPLQGARRAVERERTKQT